MSKHRRKADGPVLKSREDVEARVNDFALLVINHCAVCAEMDAQVVAIAKKYKPALAALEQEMDEKVSLMEAWANAHPEEFKGKKSIEFGLGRIGFRIDPPSLKLLSKWNWEKALEKVEWFLPNFIRLQPAIDKEAILAQREEEGIKFALPQCGLKVVQGEKFYVEPKTTETETRQVKEAA